MNKSELDKACFQLDMAYGYFKELHKRTACDKVLRDKAFDIAETLKYNEHQCGPASIVCKLFDKNSLGSVVTRAVRDTVCVTIYLMLSENLATRDKFTVKSEIISNQQLVEKSHKLIIRKFERRKVYSSFKDNIGYADLADMLLISK